MLKPSFSAFARASSVVPTLEHSILNFSNFASFLNLLQILWSADIAIKLAPNIVSGRVVNTLNLSLELVI